jgi:hypothetical protein
MNATNALDEILVSAAIEGVITHVPVITHGRATVFMDDGTCVYLVAEVLTS